MDELVPAGSTPSSWEGPMEQIHRQLAFMLLMSSALLALILGNFASISIVLLVGIGAVLTIQITIWSTFRRRHPRALDPAMLSYLVCTVAFALFSALALTMGILGNLSFLLLGLVTMFTTVSCWRRIKVLRDPIFRAWYAGLDVELNRLSLRSGEVMATCPNCRSVLALLVSGLTLDEVCPNCSAPLVDREEE